MILAKSQSLLKSFRHNSAVRNYPNTNSVTVKVLLIAVQYLSCHIFSLSQNNNNINSDDQIGFMIL